jgi:hypothetical protein
MEHGGPVAPPPAPLARVPASVAMEGELMPDSEGGSGIGMDGFRDRPLLPENAVGDKRERRETKEKSKFNDQETKVNLKKKRKEKIKLTRRRRTGAETKFTENENGTQGDDRKPAWEGRGGG